jgi:putative flippase GtrA
VLRAETNQGQAARYIVNGIAATAVHYAVLQFNLGVLHIPYAGLANLIAAGFGITTSFLGSRYFVFRAHAGSFRCQFARFGLLYACIALLHGSVLWVWTDLNQLDFRVGFLIATALQVVLSFWGNKVLVFR